ncbi:TPA: helix-turn-helix domain-containing protein [Elizabethkingia anophelis]
MIFAPLYNIFILLRFWELSVVSFVWLIPFPLGAYIFFSIREVWIYSCHSLFTIIVTAYIAHNYDIYFVHLPTLKIRVYDSVLITINILIIGLLLYYKDKIIKLEIISALEEKEKIELPVTLDEDEINNYDYIFQKIEWELTHNSLFKNDKLSISLLSTILKINNNYISKAIRIKGFANFNKYINTHRIEYVKKILTEADLEKITLMYIYTEAGFINQSTFNRAFKQIEGVTPSEYIRATQKNNNVDYSSND